MRLVSFSRDGVVHAGAVVGDGVIDLCKHTSYDSVRELIEADAIQSVADHIAGFPVDFPLSDVTLEIPVPDARKIWCIGVNYMNRNAEYSDVKVDPPKFPSVFFRQPASFVGHGSDLMLPPESEQFDYEGEIVIVIGKQGRRIAQSDAMDHVAGLSVMNEGSVRDWLRHASFNVTPGKNFDKSGSIGPWIETDLSGVDVTDLWLETKVNGESRQKDTTASMAFPFARIIEYVSTFGTLYPGDMIAAGTPNGAGARFDPPKWLVEGDIVEVEVPGIGILSNKVINEQV